MLRTLLAICIFGIFFLPVRYAYACSCIPPVPPHQAVEEAQAVFVGTVLGIETVKDPYTSLQVVLDVDHVVKGAKSKAITVRTATNSAACGFHFVKGERYNVYAYEAEGKLHTSLCSRTAHVEQAEEDLVALDLPELIDDGTGGGLCGGPSNMAAMQAAFLVFLVIATQRRHKG